jgi:hypothetical protein
LSLHEGFARRLKTVASVTNQTPAEYLEKFDAQIRKDLKRAISEIAD